MTLESVLEAIAGFLWGLPLLALITITGIYFTVISGAFQFRKFGHILKETFGKIFSKETEGSSGTLNPFQALTVAIGGSVGVANIAGVATAIAAGGPGAVFWMWFSALFGMIIKLAEVTLAVYYRTYDSEGEVIGGPSVYIEKGLGIEKGWKIWKPLAVLFGIGIFSTFFLTVQNYTVSEAVAGTFKINPIIISLIYVGLSYGMISGGIKGLGEVASKIVPPMLLFYVFGGIFIVFKNISLVPSTFKLIIDSAFNGHAAIGGFAGVTTAHTIRLGMSRAVYSNEAGWGTSPMVHATAKTDHPVKQGLWGAFEVFIDTLVVCSVSAFVVLITGVWESGADGATLALMGFELGLGKVGRYLIAVSIFLLGLTTTGGWYAYYETILRHLLGGQKKLRQFILKAYKLLYPIPGMIVVILAYTIGLPGQAVWLIGDISNALPTFINVFTILVLSPKFIELMKDYKARYLGIGKIDPNFKVFYEDGQVSKEKQKKEKVGSLESIDEAQELI